MSVVKLRKQPGDSSPAPERIDIEASKALRQRYRASSARTEQG
ncbi:hypothetical protein LDG_8171 [Legionella drancourtii LLAP12]|uniref:Uncharacterized protein n=1 Tax=Legionella drancourtii LLAP12 TaxID=658187 RepID=G9ES98_9GAMM|nr:hypothetical protein LDG_8171 [Legionella drancourtii LLAP12]